MSDLSGYSLFAGPELKQVLQLEKDIASIPTYKAQDIATKVGKKIHDYKPKLLGKTWYADCHYSRGFEFTSESLSSSVVILVDCSLPNVKAAIYVKGTYHRPWISKALESFIEYSLEATK